MFYVSNKVNFKIVKIRLTKCKKKLLDITYYLFLKVIILNSFKKEVRADKLLKEL